MRAAGQGTSCTVYPFHVSARSVLVAILICVLGSMRSEGFSSHRAMELRKILAPVPPTSIENEIVLLASAYLAQSRPHRMEKPSSDLMSARLYQGVLNPRG